MYIHLALLYTVFVINVFSISDIRISHDKNIKSKHDTDEDKDLQNTYYNTSSFDKKSSTAIMLEDLADIVSFGKELEYTLEKQFNVISMSFA